MAAAAVTEAVRVEAAPVAGAAPRAEVGLATAEGGLETVVAKGNGSTQSRRTPCGHEKTSAHP